MIRIQKSSKVCHSSRPEIIKNCISRIVPHLTRVNSLGCQVDGLSGSVCWYDGLGSVCKLGWFGEKSGPSLRHTDHNTPHFYGDRQVITEMDKLIESIMPVRIRHRLDRCIIDIAVGQRRSRLCLRVGDEK